MGENKAYIEVRVADKGEYLEMKVVVNYPLLPEITEIIKLSLAQEIK